jgi:uncharacterized lipoprotein YbaY
LNLEILLLPLALLILLFSIYTYSETASLSSIEENKQPITTIRGNIIIDNVTKPFRNATVYIYLEDISYQDAPAKLIRDNVIKGIRHINETDKISFSINGSVPNFNGKYAVRVDIDTNNDGVIGVGDLINTKLNMISPKLGLGYKKSLPIKVEEMR